MYLILLILFVLFGMANALILFFFQTLFLINIFSFILLMILPGALLLKSLEIKTNSFWEEASLTVGLSTVFIMLLGLGINFYFPLLGITPLAKIPVLISIDIALLTLFGINFYRHRHWIFEHKSRKKLFRWSQYFSKSRLHRFFRKVKVLDLFLGLFVLTFPALSVLGAISLNNGGGNFFTMVLIGSIGLFVLLIIVFKDNLSEVIFPTAIYFIGLSLLLMTSLRGWYLTGHDVEFEYFIFQLTKVHQLWSIDFYKDAYNASLSINILPTILSHFFNFSDIYIYKIIFQVIFAFCPVIVYLLLRKYTTPFLSFIGSFYFLIFPTFLNDMPMLNRQEIGFLFFSLLLYILFRKKKINNKPVLLFLFSFGLVTSHYSTNYIATFLIGLTYLVYIVVRMRWTKRFFTRILRLNFILRKVNKFNRKQYIPFSLVVTLFALTLVWNVLLTETSNNLADTIYRAVVNAGSIFKQENKSIDIAYSLFVSYKVSDAEFLDNYMEKLISKSKNESVQDFYDPSIIANFKPEVVPNEILPLTPIGSVLKNVGLNIFQINYNSRQFLAKFIQILTVLGVGGMLFFRSKNKYDLEYVIASFVCILMIALMILLPGVSVSYGLLRLFQQTLILLGLPVALGSLLIFVKIRKVNSLYLVAIVSVFFFLGLSGFISEVTGGYYPQLNLRNKGIYYDAYYVHENEVASIKWLSHSMIENFTVQADPITRDKLLAYGNIFTLTGNFPQIIRESAYVYAGYFNTFGNTVVSADRSLIIKFPIEFLDNNKDLVYNNGLSKIYK